MPNQGIFCSQATADVRGNFRVPTTEARRAGNIDVGALAPNKHHTASSARLCSKPTKAQWQGTESRNE